MLFLWMFYPAFSQDLDVSLSISGLQSTEGQIMAGLFDDPSHFKMKENPLYTAQAAPADTTVEIVFRGVEPGKYALAVYHDENNDGRLNSKKLGIPSEGVGFSGEWKSRMRPPDFETASFLLQRDTTFQVIMRYQKKQADDTENPE